MATTNTQLEILPTKISNIMVANIVKYETRSRMDISPNCDPL
jgi:hypothetical protein